MNVCELLQELFEEHRGTVLQAAYQITGDASQAEDALQTVFVRLLKRDESHLKEIGSAYLKRAAINAALDLVRSRKTVQAVSLEVVERRLSEESAGPERLYSALELRKWIREAISRLSPTAAEMFALSFYQDLSHKEIADLLGTSAGTVAVTLHRTRIRLQNEIESFYGEES
jgi:RNA polymerase sigma-70 factor (ECF subfamily)